MEKLTLTIPELADALNIGRNHAYALCHIEGFPAIQIGKRIVVSVEGLREWLRTQEQGKIDI